MPLSEARKRANKKWQEANEVQVKIALNRRTDGDIIEHLEKIPRKTDYFRMLVRQNLEEIEKRKL